MKKTSSGFIIIMLIFTLLGINGCDDFQNIKPNPAPPIAPGISGNGTVEDSCTEIGNLLELNGIRYSGYPNSIYLPDSSMIGDEVGRIGIKGGSATILTKETPIYEIKGFDPMDVVAVKWDNQWIIYFRDGTFESELFPQPDLEKAEAIVLLSQPGNIVGEISEPSKVKEAIDLMKAANFNEQSFTFSDENTSYYFYLTIPDDKTVYRLAALYYIEFDDSSQIGCIEGLYTQPELFTLFQEHTFK